MKNTPQGGEYQDFYQALTPPDYLSDIEIQDEYEKPSDSSTRGLSDEQVSQIASDSLRDANRRQRRPKAESGAQEPSDQRSN